MNIEPLNPYRVIKLVQKTSAPKTVEHKFVSEMQNPYMREIGLAYQIHDQFAQCKLLKNLNKLEKNRFMKIIKNDVHEVSALASENKPGFYFAWPITSKNQGDKDLRIIKKVFDKDKYIISPFTLFDDRTCGYAVVLNKNGLKNRINDAHDIFTARMGLSKNTKTDDIIKIFESGKNMFNERQDLLGISLGYPVKDCIIYNLDELAKAKGLHEFSINMDKNYVNDLKKVLYSEESPYKNLPPNVKSEIAEKIQGITKRTMLKDFIKIKNCYDIPYKCAVFSEKGSTDDLVRIDRAIVKDNQDLMTIRPPKDRNAFLKDKNVKNFLVSRMLLHLFQKK